MSVYFAIDSHMNGDGREYRVWRRSGNEATAVLVGRHSTLDMAMASVGVEWRGGRGRLHAWGVEQAPAPMTTVA